MRKVIITQSGTLTEKLCPYSEINRKCGQWCPLFTEEDVEDGTMIADWHINLVRCVQIMCGCEPVIYEIERDDRK